MKSAHDPSRTKAIAARYVAGETLQQIADSYSISRERVRQILKEQTSIQPKQGGSAVRAARLRRDKASKRDIAYMEKLGCDWEQYKRIRALGREAKTKGVSYDRSPIGAFIVQKYHAGARGIVWNFKFWDWWEVWQSSGRWEQRGRGQGYVMCRRNDEGPYEKGNVFIATSIENISSSRHKKSGLPTGVVLKRGAYEARRAVGGKSMYLGRFKTPALAYAAYVAAAPGLHSSSSPSAMGNGVDRAAPASVDGARA